MTDESIPSTTYSHIFVMPTAPTMSLANGDIWIDSWVNPTTLKPWYVGLTHRQWLDYTSSLARKYTQRPRRPQIARQRRLIKEYGEAYRWPPQYRHPVYR